MDAFQGLEHIVRENEPLAPYTWLRLGGPAQYFAEPTSEDELIALVKQSRDASIPVRLLGGGSNLVIRDEGVDGLVIHLSAAAFAQVSIEGQHVTAGGAAKLSHVISASVAQGLAGLEQLVGIPGTVGGALHGNAGTSGGDIGQWTRSARVLTRSGELLTRQRDDLRFAYRQSSLDELVVLEASFALERDDPQLLTKRMQTLWIVKQASQPRGSQNVCCAFKDPDGASAASLIEQAGARNLEVGGACVSDEDANFIVASPGATSRDVCELIEQIKQRVSQQIGVELETSIEIW